MILTSDKRPVQAKAIAHVEDAVAMAYAVRPYSGETWTVENGLNSHSFKVGDAPFTRALLIAQAIFECERYSASPMPLPVFHGAEPSPALHVQLVGRGKRHTPEANTKWMADFTARLHAEPKFEKPALPQGWLGKWMLYGLLSWCGVALIALAVAGAVS